LLNWAERQKDGDQKFRLRKLFLASKINLSMKNYFYFGLLSIVSCSSITRPLQYKPILPKSKDFKAFYIGNYNDRMLGMQFKKNDKHHQSVWIEIENYGVKNYTFGPPFLPILPDFFTGHNLINKSEDLRLRVHAYSSMDPSEDVSKIETPTIITLSNKELKPIFEKNCDPDVNGKKCFIYTYPVKVGDMKQVTVQPFNVILTNGSTLDIPKVNFKYIEKLRIDWFSAFAP
jgi:hypothetical protein